MVEGSFATGSNNRRHDTIQIAEHVAGSKSNGAKAALGHFPIALDVMCILMRCIVDRPIDLDRQSLTEACKVEAVRTDRMLATEFVTTRPRL